MSTNKTSWLDRPLLTSITLDREKALYALFIALALVSRLWDLDFHVMSHDETVHARWSWNLYQGQPHGYEHHPLSHGPFLFNATALVYYMFGDNDGIVVVPRDLTLAVLEKAEEYYESERKSRLAMASGRDAFDVYEEFGRF